MLLRSHHNESVDRALERLNVAAKGRDDLEQYLAEARAAGASDQAIMRTLRSVYGDRIPAIAAPHQPK